MKNNTLIPITSLGTKFDEKIDTLANINLYFSVKYEINLQL